MDYSKPKLNLYGFELPNADSLRVEQVVQILHCSDQHVRDLIHVEELTGFNISPNKQICRRITRSSLIDFIERRTTGPLDEVDFLALETPHNLKVPTEIFLSMKQVAAFLNCSHMHIVNLVEAWELVATNIGLTEPGQKRRLIHRAALIHFVNTRVEGAY